MLDTQLFTHKTKGGLYRLKGISKGAGVQRGQYFHIYEDYFTGQIYHREEDEWKQNMVPAKERYIYFVNRFFMSVNEIFASLMVFAILYISHIAFKGSVPEASMILAQLAGMFVLVLALRIPIYIKHRKKYVQGTF